MSGHIPKLTRNIEQQLKVRAAKLPPCDYKYKVKVTGREMLEQGITKTDAGEIIHPHHKLEAEQTGDANHFRRLKTAFKNAGWDGVTEYEAAIIKMTKTAIIDAKKQINDYKESMKPNLVQAWLIKVILFIRKMFKRK